MKVHPSPWIVASVAGFVLAGLSEGMSALAPPQRSAGHAWENLRVWGDFDGDGLRDLYVVGRGSSDRLFRNLGDGRFEDVTVDAGLAGVKGTRSAVWLDFNRDQHADLFRLDELGRLDLFQGTSSSVFEEVGASLGLRFQEAAVDTEWLDYDGDGWLDLRLEMAGRGPVFLHSLAGTNFERVELESSMLGVPGLEGVEEASRGEAESRDATRPDAAPEESGPGEAKPGLEQENRLRPPRTSLVPTGLEDLPLDAPDADGAQVALQPSGSSILCVDSIKDQGAAGCLQASSVPTLGMLYPISDKLFVGASGNVGIGTTSPAYALHVETSSPFPLLVETSDAVARVRFEGASATSIQASFSTNKALSIYGGSDSTNGGYITVSGNTAPDGTGTGSGTTLIESARQSPVADILFRTQAANRMIISQDGNVGIGTTSPEVALDVAGDIALSSDRKVRARYDGTNSYSGTLDWRGLQLGNNGDNYIAAGRTTPGGRLGFVVNNTADLPSINGTIAMSLLENGNVGIGTTAPATKLEVVDTLRVSRPGNPQHYVELFGANSSSDPYINTAPGLGFSLRAEGTTRIYIAPGTGNIGLGTFSPGSYLTVQGLIETAGGIKFPDTTVQTTAQLVGPQGPQGSSGPQGPAGPAVTTSAVCYNNAALSCAAACGGQQYTQVAIDNVGLCTVTSDTGSCTQSSVNSTSHCCVCTPH